MHRVELKAIIIIGVEPIDFPVPNAPCGVESGIFAEDLGY